MYDLVVLYLIKINKMIKVKTVIPRIDQKKYMLRDSQE